MYFKSKIINAHICLMEVVGATCLSLLNVYVVAQGDEAALTLAGLVMPKYRSRFLLQIIVDYLYMFLHKHVSFSIFS
jgi:hypothetical protein